MCQILLNAKAPGSGSDSKSIGDSVRLVAVAAAVDEFVVVPGFAVAVGVLVAVGLSVDFLDVAADGNSVGTAFVRLSPAEAEHTYASRRPLAECV